MFPFFGMGGKKKFYPYSIDYAAKFDGTASLTRTYSVSAGWTFSAWVKRTELAALNKVLGTDIQFNSGDTITAEGLTTTAVYRDPSHWLHLYVSDNGLYINGIKIGDVTTGALSNAALFDAFDGYAAKVYLIDGSTVGVDSFGEFKNNTWVPKRYTGSYGTNGFHLDFADPTDLGKDVSGNGNHFTNTGVVQTQDTPTNNYATLDPVDPLSIGTITAAGLTVAGGTAKPTIRPDSGKWYYEKDGVGITYDADTNGEFSPDLAEGSYNFGAEPFSDTRPAGYKTICTANLPTPEVIDGEQGLWVNTRPGTGAAVNVTGAPFDVSQKSLVWIKQRDGVAVHHQLYDTMRGAEQALFSSLTDAEVNNTVGLTDFLLNGFSLGDSIYLNGSGNNYVDWVFNMLPEYGMDIVLYTGDGVAGRQVAHGLGVEPEMIVTKNRDFAYSWVVYHKNAHATAPETGYLLLNSTDAFSTATAAWNDTAPDASNFTVGTGNANTNGDRIVAYLFRNVPGFLKVGYYIGNGSTDGPRVYTGFRPRYLLVKPTSTTGSWYLIDAARNPYNVADEWLFPDLSNAETTGSTALMDFLANGFKVRGSATAVNGSGHHYIYLAIADMAFPFCNAF